MGSAVEQPSLNKSLLEDAITGTLILVMLIPIIFISNLMQERQHRQSKVVTGKVQVLTGPYIYLPYKTIIIHKDQKVTEQISHLNILPDNPDVNGRISRELKSRPIHRVLSDKASLHTLEKFSFRIPKEMDTNLIQWHDARICYGLSDFSGIEEGLVVNFNGSDYELLPGLPSNDISKKGLSSPIPLAVTDTENNMLFTTSLNIKGNEQIVLYRLEAMIILF